MWKQRTDPVAVEKKRKRDQEAELKKEELSNQSQRTEMGSQEQGRQS
jgi:hypothetical protein